MADKDHNAGLVTAWKPLNNDEN